MNKDVEVSLSGVEFSYNSSKEFSYYLTNPCDSTLYYRTEADMLKDSEYIIGLYLDDGWNEEVEYIEAGKVMYSVVKFDIQKKPPTVELDEACCDEDGMYWGEFGYICNYKLYKI